MNSNDSHQVSSKDLHIEQLGKSAIDSPCPTRLDNPSLCELRYVDDQEGLLFNPTVSAKTTASNNPLVQLSGPRAKIYFNAPDVRAAIVTCGGLCPGINDVIRGIVMTLFYQYGVTQVSGIRYGYQGFLSKYGHAAMKLTPDSVSRIHTVGGSVLATSRGFEDLSGVVRYLREHRINQLYVIGGDGTMRGAMDIADEAAKAKHELSVVGVPKTVDNDIEYIDESFGFVTAFSEAARSISSAHAEAKCAPNGIGLVKLMGRHSGFIACHAALAMNDVNYVLIPEVPFQLAGKKGFLNLLLHRMKQKGHAVIVVAEGAGQEYLNIDETQTDASGNVRLKDIGLFLKEKIARFFVEHDEHVNVKYIDPSYMIRSVPAAPIDSVYCLRLATDAVHAAMAGKTKVVVAKRANQYVYLPMALLSKGRKRVDPEGALWFSVLDATGQPSRFTD